MKTADVEIAVANYFRPRVNMVIPNVSWAFSHYEMDLIVVTQSNFIYEIEIKVTRADLKADKNKRHNHDCNKTKFLFFAIPEKLLDCRAYIPDDAGIIVCGECAYTDTITETRMFRKPKKRTNYELPYSERLLLARLGYLRMWDLKSKINQLKNILK